MSKTVFRDLSLIVFVFIIAASFGACKKKDNSTAEPRTTKTIESSVTTSKNTSGTKVNVSTSSATSSVKTITTKTDSQEISKDNQNSADPEVIPDEQYNIQDSETENTQTAPGEILMDLKGRKFIIATRGERPTEPEQPEEDGLSTSTAFARNMKIAEAKYNMVIEWKTVPGGTGEITVQFINSMAAGLHFADVVELATKQAFPVIAENSFIVPINDYIDFNKEPYNTNYLNTCGFYRGKNYGFTQPLELNGFGIFFNKDIVYKEGLPDLHEVTENGNWTWDMFLDVAQRTTKDLNGDGVIDQWGIQMYRGDYPYNAFVFSNGGSYIEDIAGKLTFVLPEARSVKALQFMSDLINVYKVMKQEDSMPLKFEQSGSAMFIGEKVTYAEDLKLMDVVNFGFLPLPKGPDVDEYQVITNGSSMYTFPANTNYAENIPVFMDISTLWDSTKSEYITLDKYLRGTAEKCARYDWEVNFYIKYFSDPKVSQHQAYPDVQKLIKNEVYYKVADKISTPAAALESMKGPAQEMLDALVGQ